MKIVKLTLIILLCMISVSHSESFLFMGGGGNFQMFQDAGKVDLKSAPGFSFGFGATINNRWAVWSFYDYYVAGINNPEMADSSTSLFKSDYFTMTTYLLNSDTTDFFRAYLLGGFEGSYSNIPEFGDFLSGVLGLMFAVDVYKGFNVWAAGTLNVSDNYAYSKLRLGLAYPLSSK